MEMVANDIALQRLQKAVQYAFENTPFYKEHFAGKFDPNQPFSLENYQALPFTTKDDIATRNIDFLSVPKNEIAEYVTTSGTSGDPVTIYLTKNDLDRLAENERFSLSLMNGSSDDLYQLLTTIDKQFMAGIAYYLGVQKLNAGMIRLGPGVVSAQWSSILLNQPTKLIAVPSFILSLLDYAERNGIDPNSTSVTDIICIGEPIRDNDFNLNVLGEKICSRWNVNLFSTYASTEMATAFSECTAQQGGHLNPELLFLEVLDEEGNQVQNGEAGEVVITTLGVEGAPVVRYKTGDIATYWSEPCSCGLDTPRLGTILGRKNQLIKFKGTSVYPQAIQNVLKSAAKVGLYHIIVSKDSSGIDQLRVLLPAETTMPSQVIDIQSKFKSHLKVNPVLELLPTKEIEQMTFVKEKRKPNFVTFK